MQTQYMIGSKKIVCYEAFMSGAKIKGEPKLKHIIITYNNKSGGNAICSSVFKIALVNLYIYSKLQKKEKDLAKRAP